MTSPPPPPATGPEPGDESPPAPGPEPVAPQPGYPQPQQPQQPGYPQPPYQQQPGYPQPPYQQQPGYPQPPYQQQPGYPQPPYPQAGPYGVPGPVPGEVGSDDPGKALGIAGIVLAFVPPLIGPIVGIVLSSMSRGKSKAVGLKPTLGTIGLVLSIVMLVLTLGGLAAGIGIGIASYNSQDRAFCHASNQLAKDFAGSTTPDANDPGDYVDTVRQASKELDSIDPPDEVADDWDFTAQYFRTLAGAFDGIDEHDPDQFQQAIESVTPQLQPQIDQLRTATTNIDAYGSKVCD